MCLLHNAVVAVYWNAPAGIIISGTRSEKTYNFNKSGSFTSNNCYLENKFSPESGRVPEHEANHPLNGVQKATSTRLT